MNDESLTPMPDEGNIRRRQILVVVLAFVVVGALVIYVYYSSLPPEHLYTSKKEAIVTRKIEKPAPVDERELWRAQSQKELLRLTQENKKLGEALDQLTARVTAILEVDKKAGNKASFPRRPPAATLPPVPETPSIGTELLPPPPRPSIPGRQGDSITSQSTSAGAPTTVSRPANSERPPASNSGFFVIDIAGKATSLADNDKPAERKTVDNYLPPGTYIKTRLLSGLDAPTGGQAQKDPVPFLLRLTDNGQLPNGFRSHVKHCFVTLAGVGNISDSRVYGRAEKIACVLKDKSVFDANIKAYVSGEDGKAGLHGNLRNKRGQLIAYSLLSGLGGGLGEAIAQSFTTIATNPIGSTTTVDPGEIGKFGLAQGFGTALDRISRWYLDRADEIYPVLEVHAGRTPELVFLEGLQFTAQSSPNRPHQPLVTAQAAKRPGILEGQ